jgi:SAM-dependent methyltransferase
MFMRKFLSTIHHLRKNLGFNIIFDVEKRLGNFSRTTNNFSNLYSCKEDISREFVLKRPGVGLNFLDVGAKDGSLRYLLGIKSNLEFDENFYHENKTQFFRKYNYFGCDLKPVDSQEVLVGDVCDPAFLNDKAKFLDFFDVIYSNNVFEHLHRPWKACEHIYKMLNKGGVCITIVPFSQRYHEDPGDYFRYTHTALPRLFEDCGAVETLFCGYDIVGRRNNWQGSGQNNDLVPIDRFGAWRETWFTISIIKKL